MSSIIFFKRVPKGDECRCPCHVGAQGRFHCFSICCSMPDVIMKAGKLEDTLKEVLTAEENVGQ